MEKTGKTVYSEVKNLLLFNLYTYKNSVMEDQVSSQEPSQFETVDFNSPSDGLKENNENSEQHENGDTDHQNPQADGNDTIEDQVLFFWFN